MIQDDPPLRASTRPRRARRRDTSRRRGGSRAAGSRRGGRRRRRSAASPRSRENQIAPAKAAIASRMTSQLSVLIVFTAVWAASSWSDSAPSPDPRPGQPRVELLAEAELLPDRDDEHAKVEHDRRRLRSNSSRVSSSRTRSNVWCAARLMFSQRSCTRGRCRKRRRPARTAGAVRPRSARRAPVVRGQRSSSRFSTSTFRRADRRCRSRAPPNVLVVEQLRTRVDPRVRIERLPLDPDRERADDQDQRSESQQPQARIERVRDSRVEVRAAGGAGIIPSE